MKSLTFATLFIVVIINAVFAQYNQESYTNEIAQPAQPAQPYQPYQQETQPVQPYQQETQPVQPYQQEAQPVQPYQQETQPVQPYQQETQPTQPVQQETQPTQPVQQETQPTQPVQQEVPPQETQTTQEENNEGSSHKATLAVTGVAFALIAGAGYKNYKKDSKFKLPELPAIPGLSTPKENTNDQVVVEMELLLDEASEAEYSLAKNRAYKCMVSWTPKQSDEIILRRGDLVCVKECFNDGYTLGRNLSTKFDGIFPTCCLCRQDQNIIGCNLIKNGKFTAIPKRVTSKNRKERRARRASRGVSFLSSVPGWNKAGFTSIPQY